MGFPAAIHDSLQKFAGWVCNKMNFRDAEHVGTNDVPMTPNNLGKIGDGDARTK